MIVVRLSYVRHTSSPQVFLNQVGRITFRSIVGMVREVRHSLRFTIVVLRITLALYQQNRLPRQVLLHPAIYRMMISLIVLDCKLMVPLHPSNYSDVALPKPMNQLAGIGSTHNLSIIQFGIISQHPRLVALRLRLSAPMDQSIPKLLSTTFQIRPSFHLL